MSITEPPATFQPSEKCINKLCNLEGFRAYPYKDTGGLWTVGYGQRCNEHYLGPITKEVARAWLVQKVQYIARNLHSLMPKLLPHQVDALVLFIYNIGWDAFIHSGTCTLLKQKKTGALIKWNQWNKDEKMQIQEGLIIRRQFETQLFVYGWQ